LDNIEHLQSSWVTQGKKIGQLALHFGADDMGSIMIEENVVSAAGTSYRMSQEEMEHLITAAGFQPRQRTNLYERRVSRQETDSLVERFAHALTPENRDLASGLRVVQ
jgi:2-iminoacetate synthase ThiH